MTPDADSQGRITTEKLIYLISSASSQFVGANNPLANTNVRTHGAYEKPFSAFNTLYATALSSYADVESFDWYPQSYVRYDTAGIRDWEENDGYNPGTNQAFITDSVKLTTILAESVTTRRKNFTAPVTASILSSSQYIGLDGGTF